MVTVNKRFLSLIAVSILLLGLTCTAEASDSAGNDTAAANVQLSNMAKQVRNSLVTLSFLSVFDNLNCIVEDSGTVVLAGQVIRPTLKKDAEAVVRDVPGVKKVVNNIEVLPQSPYDDAIRLQTYRAIYSRGGFERYAIQATLPIRIIVKNGNVTLDGVVGTQLDKTMADMTAKSVPGVFSVTNNLKVG